MSEYENVGGDRAGGVQCTNAKASAPLLLNLLLAVLEAALTIYSFSVLTNSKGGEHSVL